MGEMDKYYDEEYYKSHCGEEYEHGQGWEKIFANYADHIVKEINPKKTLDVGCAVGFLVEALADRGVDAYGIDISDYAIANVRKDMKSRCMVQSALAPIEERYDLITCIEVLEHLENKDISLAIQRMCEATDDIIFSSTPFDYNEESHISVHTPEYWAEQFAYNGFYHDVSYDCSYIAVQTMRFRKVEKSKADIIREYERELFQKHQEIVAVRHQLKLSEENVQIYKEAYQKHVDMINDELNPQINELNKRLIDKDANMQMHIEEIRTSYENDLNKKDANMRAQIEEAKAKYENELNKQLTDKDANMRAQIEEIKTNYENDLNKKIEEFRVQLEKDYNDKLDEKVEEIKSQFELICRNKLDEEIKQRKRIEQNYYIERELSKETEKQLQKSIDESCYERKLREETEQQLQKSKNECDYERRLREEAEHKFRKAVDEAEWKFREITDKTDQEIALTNIQNQKMKETNNILMEEINALCDNYYSDIKRIMKQRRSKYVTDKKLLKKDKSYWEPVFDAEYYMEHNKDIYDVYGNNKDELLKHFICYGMNEGRRANDEFDLGAYMLFNPDITKVWKLDRRAYYLHYIENGKKEKRCARF